MNLQIHWFPAAEINIMMGAGCGFCYRRVVNLVLFFKRTSFSDARYSVCIVSVFRLALVHIATIRHNFSRRLLYNEHSHRIVAYQTVRLRCSGSTLVNCRSRVGITYASMPAMKPLLVQLFPSLLEPKRPPRHTTYAFAYCDR